MPWLAVEQNYYHKETGEIVSEPEVTEVMTDTYPERVDYAGVLKEYFFWMAENVVYLPKGTIKRILGYPLTVYDDPVELS